MQRLQFVLISIIFRTIRFFSYGLLLLVLSFVAFAFSEGIPSFYLITVYLLMIAIPVMHLWFIHLSSEFVTDFFMSGHWKKMNRGHLRSRNTDSPIPDFRKMKYVSLGSLAGMMVFAWFILQELIIPDLVHANSHNTLGSTIAYASGYAFLLVIYCIYFRWVWKGMLFVERYEPFR